MKIIDNKKDYYDYLMGIYGIDEKIVYDRRDSVTKEYFCKSKGYSWYPNENPFDSAYEMTLRVGNMQYKFVRNKDTDYKWDMPKFAYRGYYRGYSRQVETITNPMRISDEELEQWKENDCPIVLTISYSRDYWWNRGSDIVIRNPILSTFGVIPKFITPNEIWENVYDFISHKNDKKIVDNRTDVEKLESHGFDKRTSFRNM
jgi:hypothetical protein